MAFKEKIDEIKIFETLLLFLTNIWWIQNSSSLSITLEEAKLLHVVSILKNIFEKFGSTSNEVEIIRLPEMSTRSWFCHQNLQNVTNITSLTPTSRL